MPFIGRRRYGVKRRSFKRMAKYGSRRSSSGRRKTLWKKRKGSASTTIIRQPTLLSDRTKIKFRFTQSLSIESTTGVLGYYQYRGNSLFDPDQTGVGTQPYGYDQWSNLYDCYRVYGSSIAITFTTAPVDSGSNAGVLVCGVYPQSNASDVPSTLTETLERPYRKFKTMTSYTPKTVKAYISTNKIQGQSKSIVSYDPSYIATLGNSGSNPAVQWNWTVFACTADEVTTSACIAHVTVTYYAVLSCRAQLGLS